MSKTDLIFSSDSEALLRELGLKNLSERDKKETLDALLDHFNKVIVETAILSLDEDGLKKFKSALQGKRLEEEVASLCAMVPGLADKIEGAVENEFRVIKAAKGCI